MYLKKYISILMPAWLTLITLVKVDAQNQHYVDSLTQVYEQAASDSLRILSLRRIAWHYLRYDLRQARVYTDRFRAIARAAGHQHSLAVSDHYRGLIDRLEGNYPEALTSFNQALSFYQSDTSYRASQLGALFNIGVVYQLAGDFEKALDYFFRELDLRDSLGVEEGTANTLNSIGVTYKKMRAYDKALDIYNRAYELCRARQDSATMSLILHNRSLLKNLQEDYLSSISDAEAALAIDRQDDFAKGIASNYELLARNYMQLNQYETALRLADQSLEIRQNLGEQKELLHAYMSLAEIHGHLQNTSTAISYAREGLNISRSLDLPEETRTLYQLLAKAYRENGDSESAVQAYQEVIAWSDTLFNAEKLRQARELEVKYQIKETEKNLALLRAENADQEAALLKQIRWKTWLAIALGLSLFSLILIARIYGLKLMATQLKNEKIAIQREQELQTLKANNQILQMKAMINGQEAERSRIAQDLHDGLGGLLATVKLHFASIQKDIAALNKLNIYQKATHLLDDACDEVRRIAHNMMPDALASLGLSAGLEDLAEALRLKGLEVHVKTVLLEDRLEPEMEIGLFRIIQELTNNIVKHAQADKVIIQLSRHDDELFMIVEDDGVGFDPLKSHKGMGLKSISSRVAYLNGMLDIDSRPGEGTSVGVSIPLQASTPTPASIGQ